HRSSVDDRGVVGDSLMVVEVRVLQPEALEHRKPLLQFHHLGELLDRVYRRVSRQSRSVGFRQRWARAAPKEARVPVLEIPPHAARGCKDLSAAMLNRKRALNLVPVRVLQSEADPQGTVVQGRELTVLGDAGGKTRSPQVRPGPVGRELKSTVQGERINGPVVPRW